MSKGGLATTSRVERLPLFSTEYRRRQAFEKFHAANPEVYAHLVRLAREAKALGHQRIGIRLLWEKMRWDLTVAVRRTDEFRLNDHWPPYYSRLIQQQEADLQGVFATRDPQ